MGGAVSVGFWVTVAIIAGIMFFAPEIFLVVFLFQEACS